MATTREAALESLAALLTATFGAKFSRDPEAAEDDASSGSVVMRDGKPSVLDSTVGLVTYTLEHNVPIEIAATGAARTATVDGLVKQLDTALAGAGYNLSGAVLDARVVDAPDIVETDKIDGVEPVRYALVDVRLEYVATSPTG